MPTRPALLVVEDDHDVREALREVLEDDGWTVATASDGAQALALLRAGLAVEVILLDLMMPGMNGWQFRAEQQKDATLARTPVILLSADATPSPPIKTEGTLRKPVRLATLLAEVARFRSRAGD